MCDLAWPKSSQRAAYELPQGSAEATPVLFGMPGMCALGPSEAREEKQKQEKEEMDKRLGEGLANGFCWFLSFRVK